MERAYTITGFAYNQGADPVDGIREYSQVFSWVDDPEKYPTIDGLSAILNSYAEKINSEQEMLQDALDDVAKAVSKAAAAGVVIYRKRKADR